MEHAAHIVEAILAAFGTFKFFHEMFELLHHAHHVVAKLRK